MADKKPPIEILTDTPLAPLTTLGVGGAADVLLRLHALEALPEALRLIKRRGAKVFVLGGGSNVVFPDTGMRQTILQPLFGNILMLQETSTDVTILVEAGCSWDALVAYSVSQGWSGLECLSGIPGDAGAAPMQNIGAYGQEVAAVMTKVHTAELSSGQRRIFHHDECAFDYRTSLFKHMPQGELLITALELTLSKVTQPRAAYRELEEYLATQHEGWERLPRPQQLALLRQAVLTIRRKKSMVYDAADPHSHSCGSFFLNPLVTQSMLLNLEARYPQLSIPRFAHGNRWKLPAAWLVEHAGFPRGYRDGQVGLSPRHALAIVNYGGTAAAVVALSRKIQDAVAAAFAIQLKPEPLLLAATDP